MGRPEGPGCYCYANNLLRDILGTIQADYDYVVIDNEAGMEHLSRRTAQAIDVLLIVSDATVRGVRAAGKIARLLEELKTRTRARHLVLNRVRGAVPGPVLEAIREENLELAALIPEDEGLLRADQNGQGVGGWPDHSPAGTAVDEMMTRALKIKPRKDDR
jgi:CO dehydrogenase maturation factor